MEHVAQGRRDKGKGKETSPANTSTTVSRDDPSLSATFTSTTSHVKKLIGMTFPLSICRIVL